VERAEVGGEDEVAPPFRDDGGVGEVPRDESSHLEEDAESNEFGEGIVARMASELDREERDKPPSGPTLKLGFATPSGKGAARKGDEH
jgi:hypothetical protein